MPTRLNSGESSYFFLPNPPTSTCVSKRLTRPTKSKSTAIKRIGQALGRSLKVLLFIPPVLLGVLAIYYAGQNAKAPERVPEQEQVRVLRVIKVPTLDVTPRAIGYGTAPVSYTHLTLPTKA